MKHFKLPICPTSRSCTNVKSFIIDCSRQGAEHRQLLLRLERQMSFSLVNTLNCVAMENFQWLNCVLGASNNLTSQISKVLLPKCHCIQIFLFCEMLSLKQFISRQNRIVGGKQILLKEHLNCTQQMKQPEILYCSLRVLLPLTMVLCCLF